MKRYNPTTRPRHPTGVKRYAELTGIGTVRSEDKKPRDNKMIKSSDTLTFTCNYTKADFTAVNAMASKPLFYELSFSDGSKFVWQGQHTCGLPGKGVNEVIEFTINIAASTPVEFSAED